MEKNFFNKYNGKCKSDFFYDKEDKNFVVL